MKYDFTISNLEVIKPSISKIPISNIANRIIELFSKIDFHHINADESYIEIKHNEKYGLYAEFNLVSNFCIPINICLHDKNIDFIVDQKITIFEMQKLDENEEFIDYLKKWLQNSIIIKRYVKFGFLLITKIYDSENNTLFKNTNYFYSTHLNNESKEKKFKEWI